MTPMLSLALAAIVSLGAAESLPRCDVRATGDGAPAVLVDGEPHAPLMLVLNNQFGRDAVLLNELRSAARTGIKLFGFNVLLDWHASPEQEAATVAKFCEVHPEGYFYTRIWLGPNAG